MKIPICPLPFCRPPKTLRRTYKEHLRKCPGHNRDLPQKKGKPPFLSGRKKQPRDTVFGQDIDVQDKNFRRGALLNSSVVLDGAWPDVPRFGFFGTSRDLGAHLGVPVSGLQKGLAERGHVKNRQKVSKVFRQFSRTAKHVKNRQKASKSFSTLFDNFRAAPSFRPLLGGSDSGQLEKLMQENFGLIFRSL